MALARAGDVMTMISEVTLTLLGVGWDARPYVLGRSLESLTSLLRVARRHADLRRHACS